MEKWISVPHLKWISPWMLVEHHSTVESPDRGHCSLIRGGLSQKNCSKLLLQRDEGVLVKVMDISAVEYHKQIRNTSV